MWKKGRTTIREQWDSILLTQNELLPVPHSRSLSPSRPPTPHTYTLLHSASSYLSLTCTQERTFLLGRETFCKEIRQIILWLKPSSLWEEGRDAEFFSKIPFISSRWKTCNICKALLCSSVVFLDAVFLSSHVYTLVLPAPWTFLASCSPSLYTCTF